VPASKRAGPNEGSSFVAARNSPSASVWAALTEDQPEIVMDVGALASGQQNVAEGRFRSVELAGFQVRDAL
jgi:predicted short-subunit dehydrogenase-like oxidoreductase (DUF2520 family)